jgi:hypothetical protein
MRVTIARVVQCVFLLLLCAQGFCQTPEQGSQHPSRADAVQALTGTFESAAHGDSFFGGGTSTNGVPLFTLTLGTNGTYFVFCASVFVVPDMDADRSYKGVCPGYEFGTWRWVRGYSEVVLTATNRSHMTHFFPTHLKVDQRNPNRLTAINTPPPSNLTLPHPWVSLSPPYFYRKIE